MATISFVIRDALETDIESCLTLDHAYSTDHVWKMNVMAEGEGWHMRFQKERLPRSVEYTYPSDPYQLELALAPEAGFLVAASKDEPHMMLGYLLIRMDPMHQIGRVQALLVSHQYRQAGIGTKLLSVARKWAVENGADRMIVETRTKNYPAITFLQNRGFVFCGFNDQYYQDKDIALFFGQGLR